MRFFVVSAVLATIISVSAQGDDSGYNVEITHANIGGFGGGGFGGGGGGGGNSGAGGGFGGGEGFGGGGELGGGGGGGEGGDEGGFGGGNEGGFGGGGFGGGDHHGGWHVPDYEFKYGVKDPKTGDHKEQWEQRHHDHVKGEYWLHEPDGTKRIVTYTADPKTGFHAIVKKIGHAEHPHHYGGI
uniref:Putative adult-specific cuticular protein acp-20-like halyomorpha halys n=1 Tax=Lutzomyia longipalpis TaxID=7200 RepID=A0A1B0CT47_LUTLO